MFTPSVEELSILLIHLITSHKYIQPKRNSGSIILQHLHLTVTPLNTFFVADFSIRYYSNAMENVAYADEETLQSIDEAYNTLLNSNSRSLVKKYLTRDVYDKIKERVTPNGASLLDVINSGVENVDSNIGIYAPDAESYSIFRELFDPIIDEYHGGFGPSSCHPRLDFGHANSLGDLNSKGDFVVSTRVRCARSIEGYPFNPLLTSEHYAELEEDITRALGSLDEDLNGQYTPINRLSPEEQEDLLERHLLFKQGDRFLQAAGACRYWPDGRGIFLNDDSTLVVWVNEEDHMRIISMEPGGDLGAVYERFTRAVTSLGQILPFSSSPRFGFLTFCPTNLGTAIRASVHIRLPNLGQDRRILEDTADRFNLQVRGTSGEHSEAMDFVFDISNRRRLGLTEIEALQEMYDGVQEIIDLEIQMSEAFTSDLSTQDP
ncbi:arginine kinase-like [Oratosquilla oratoria]|uniref:arginine kinase-like n=1 Tax=Oratosquilla oratoria TaxID=337810 RepID=UPI003F76B44E